jgi:hypothetical protein
MIGALTLRVPRALAMFGEPCRTPVNWLFGVGEWIQKSLSQTRLQSGQQFYLKPWRHFAPRLRKSPKSFGRGRHEITTML